MVKRCNYKILTFALLIVLNIFFFLHVISAKEKQSTLGKMNMQAQSDEERNTRSLSNVANMSYWVFHDGTSAHDPYTDDAGGIYPRGTVGVIFQDGFVYGGYVDDPDTSKPLLRVGGQTYVIGTTEGWVSNGVAVNTENPRVAIYRINPKYRKYYNEMSEDEQKIALLELRLDAAEFNGVDAEAVSNDMIIDIIDQYAHDWENWPSDLGAPVYDDGTPGIAKADQVIWFVVNDFNDETAESLYGSPSMGMELQITIWAYNQPNSKLGQVIFKRYRLINKGSFHVDSMFVCQWSDPDVGNYSDDLVGCDVERSLGFAYTGYVADDQYSDVDLPPAAVGYDFFQGPIIYTGNPADTAIFDLKYRPGYINLPMTSFGYFAAGSPIDDPDLGEYESTKKWYNMINGYKPTDNLANPTPYTHGAGSNVDESTKFPLDGDPFNGTGDLDGTGKNLPPGDRRMLLPSGPFTLMPGDTQEVVVGVVVGIIEQAGGDNVNAVFQMQLNDDYAQFVYDNLFDVIPVPPTKPIVNVTPNKTKIGLEWGDNPTTIRETEKDTLDYSFEGYNIYQLPNASATKEQAKLIATFDLNNGLRKIWDNKFVSAARDIVLAPIQIGTDSGIQRHITVERDYINDRPIYPGNTYYFSVTAYNYTDDPEKPVPTLECDLKPVIIVVAQEEIPGIEYADNLDNLLEITKIGTSTGSVEVTVVNPEALTGDSYRVWFSSDSNFTTKANYDVTGTIIESYDTLGVWHKWNLTNETTGEIIISDEINFSGDIREGEFPVFDGLTIRVIGAKTFGLAGVETDITPWFTGVDWGGAAMGGGIDIGYNFFGSTLANEDMIPIQVIFQDKADVAANGYLSKGAVYRRDLGYEYVGIGDLPLAAYSMLDPENPRRLNICFVEDVDAGNDNMIWDMGLDPATGEAAALGGREYLFFMMSDYNEGADYDNDENWGPAADVLYALWPDIDEDHDFLRTDYLMAPLTLDFLANIPNTPDDEFLFSSTQAIKNNAALMKGEVKKINVFPNPYYADIPAEGNRFERFVTFTHLPHKVKVRIFNLAGILVRTLTENDKLSEESQFLRWDLKNENDLPVGSGMYIAHIDMPDIKKTKVLKVFIVQSAQILKYY